MSDPVTERAVSIAAGGDPYETLWQQAEANLTEVHAKLAAVDELNARLAPQIRRLSDHALAVEAKLAEAERMRGMWEARASAAEKHMRDRDGDQPECDESCNGGVWKEQRDAALAALREAKTTMRNAWGAITSGQVNDKQVDKALLKGVEKIDAALTSYAVPSQGGEP